LYPPGVIKRAPIPTLVTYSTIMSRAMYLGKPLVALRLWTLMRQQHEFFSTSIGIKVPTELRIIPDVKAANILMNVYAKLGDVTSALDLLDQMHHGTGKDVPKMRPNIVTYNTLLDACHIGGELDIALRIKDELEHAGLRPDARTYTTLIATVARKANAISGANDPTLAFSILEEMQQRHVRPNGMTFSALIDVCGRCRRSDLALKGLRIMLDQKTLEQGYLEWNNDNKESPQKYTLYNEVGAWTAAINACGKAGRIETAVKLFYAMPNFGVFPNTITCGCLTDCLLRNGRTADTLNVLRYMKKHRIAPSEVMYTSLITSAGRLAQFENEQQNILTLAAPNEEDQFPVDESGATKAIEMYTELIMSLAEKQGAKSRTNKYTGVRDKTNEKEDSNELLKVFLVFQEMKTVGAHPDLACYNALLKTCAIAGDVERAQEVLRQIQDDGDIDPNDTTVRHMMIAAGKSARSDVAISTWKAALAHRSQHDDDADSSTHKWRPSVDSLGAFVAALLHSASDLDEQDKHSRVGLYRLVVNMYKDICSESKNALGVHRVNREKVLQNPWIMLMFLQASVSLEKELRSEKNMPQSGYTKELRSLAASIVASPCFKNGVPHSLRKNKSLFDSFQVGETWLKLR
jgi:pentatricopeptide repeat protein